MLQYYFKNRHWIDIVLFKKDTNIYLIQQKIVKNATKLRKVAFENIIKK